MRELRPTLQRSDQEIQVRFASLRTSADVSDLLEVDHAYLKRLLRLRRERSRYQQFTVPKAAGGVRIIDAPPRALRILQQKLNYVFQLVYSPKPAVHGFVRGRSIVTNAVQHVGKQWVLNIDLSDFFPSIHLGRIRGALMARPFQLQQYAAIAIAQLCTREDGILPQGAPTSPFLSNIICARLDGDLMALAKRHGLTYTRYCDDITLSSRRRTFPTGIAQSEFGWVGSGVVIGDSLGQVIESNGFKMNAAKTRLQIATCHQEVTGLVVNQFPNISREYVRSLRGILYAWRRHGLSNAALEFARRNNLSTSNPSALESHFSAVVRGRIEYVGYVRGRRDPVYCKLRNGLNRIAPTLIKEAPSPDRYRILPRSATGDRWTKLYDRWRHSIGLLEVDSGKAMSMGTAFAIHSGELVTAAHNLKGNVSLTANSHSLPLSEYFIHPRDIEDVDVVLAAVQHNLPLLPFEIREAVQGESVAVLGFASVPGRHPTLGVYPGTVETIAQSYRGINFLQVSVQASGGLSGSPMLDSSGRVLGLVVESLYERTEKEVPSREFISVLPIQYAIEVRNETPRLSRHL